jgi:hypothetical protein
VGASLAGFPLGWWLDTRGLSSGITLLGVASLVFGLLAIGIRRPGEASDQDGPTSSVDSEE